MSVQKKIAFITGANRGIGLETARGLGELGVTVLLGTRDIVKGEEVAESLRRQGNAEAERLLRESIDADLISRVPRPIWE